MKILYSVQGTGNGHISRASAMHNAFKATQGLILPGCSVAGTVLMDVVILSTSSGAQA